MGPGELWFCLTISVVMWPQSPQSPAQISPPTHWPHWGTHVATVSHADTRHKKLVLKLFLIIFESYPLQEIVDRYFSRSLLIDKIGSSDDKITLIQDICYQGSASHPNCVLSPMLLVQISDQWKHKVNSTLLISLSRTRRKINSQGGLSFLSSWPIFCHNDIPGPQYWPLLCL